MTTGEGGGTGESPRNGQARPDDDRRRGERIGVGGADDSVSRIQLAARWAEAFAGEGDSLAAMLRRFRAAYEYLDAVIHGVEPPEIDSVAETPAPAPATQPAPPPWSNPEPSPSPAPPPWSNPEPSPSPAPPPWASPRPQEPGSPPTEPRPWG